MSVGASLSEAFTESHLAQYSSDYTRQIEDAINAPPDAKIMKSTSLRIGTGSRTGNVNGCSIIQNEPFDVTKSSQDSYMLGDNNVGFTEQYMSWKQPHQQVCEKPAPPLPFMKHAAPVQKPYVTQTPAKPVTIEQVYSLLVDIMKRLDAVEVAKNVQPDPTKQATDIIMFIMIGLFLIFIIDLLRGT